jgi:hypothetical protein
MMLDARFNLDAKGLLWCEAMDAATTLCNIIVNSTSTVSAYEKYYGTVPKVYEHLQPFG